MLLHADQSDAAAKWLWRKAVTIGAKLTMKGRYAYGARRIIQPIHYWRYPSYKFVAAEGEFTGGDRVLDIGSPKLFALWLTQVKGATVWATDIEPYFLDEFRLIRQLENLRDDQLHLAVLDGRQMTLPACHFDKVYSISVLEHIPHDGDSDCMREITRVLRPKGRALITVPFSPEAKDEFIGADKLYWAKNSIDVGSNRIFYQRRYSESSLHSRLIAPSGLSLKKILYVGESVMLNSDRELSNVLPRLSGPIHGLLSKWLHTPFTTSWQSLRKPLEAYVVLEKPAQA